MRDFEAGMYGEAIADMYDNGSLLAHATGGARPGETEAAVGLLTEYAGAGRVLELGVGTGRIAIALAARGIDMHGIDVSQAMVERLRAKPGGDVVTVHIGDMAEVDVAGQFTLVYAAASTLFCLTTQDQQVRCVHNVAARLEPGGRFVVEAFVPDPSRFDHGQRVEVRDITANGVHFDVTRHDRTTQTLASQQVVITEGGVRLFPIHVRYIWPAELDLMCALAGLRLERRHGGWSGQPYTSASASHVSVYTLADR